MKITRVYIHAEFENPGTSVTKIFEGEDFVTAWQKAVAANEEHQKQQRITQSQKLIKQAAELAAQAFKLRRESDSNVYSDYTSIYTVRSFLKTFSILTDEEINRIDSQFGYDAAHSFRTAYSRNPKKDLTVWLGRETRNVNVFSYGAEHMGLLMDVYASKDWHKLAMEVKQHDESNSW